MGSLKIGRYVRRLPDLHGVVFLGLVVGAEVAQLAVGK